MQFQTPLRRARITYAVIMASTTCVIMSAMTTAILRPAKEFLDIWPQVLGIDLMVAIPLAIALGPPIRRLCHRLYPDVKK